MAHGGKRAGSGRKKLRVGFRDWCRACVMRPEVLELWQKEAAQNPDFALKLAEHGFGRPPQSLDVRHGALEDGEPIRLRFDDGAAAHPGGVPAGVAAVSAELVH